VKCAVAQDRQLCIAPSLLSGVSAAQDQIQDAIDNYHKALALRPEDTLVAEMLTLAMQDSANTDYSF